MMIPGSQARFIVFPHVTGVTTGMIFRFRRATITPRVPAIDVTNNEGLPGAVRGTDWPSTEAGLLTGIANNLIAAAPNFVPFKDYPYESQLPGVGVCELEIEQASWEFDQILFHTPTVTNPIMPGRYIRGVMRPNYWQTGSRFAYSWYSLYVEESPHRIDVKGDQPITFRARSNGPWTYPNPNMNNVLPPWSRAATGGPVV
jgi:hypothetical protein